MIRSLYSGISGMRNHQVRMDISSNNIANVNTVGFKGSRVTFEESMAQLLKGASRPIGLAGGTNPIQVGLGMAVGSIDTMVTQGNLQSTGKITDLAIEGRGYFVYSDSTGGHAFSRNGALQMDANGRLVAPTNGFALQGKMANSLGIYGAGTPVGDIVIPYGQKSAANPTTQIRYQSNLDSDSEGLGTIMHSNSFLAIAEGTDVVKGMFDSRGNNIGIQAGDVLRFSAVDGGNPAAGELNTTFKIPDDTTTLDDIATELETFLNNNITDANGQIDVSIDAEGHMQIDMSSAGAGATINQLSIRSDRPTSDPYIADMFNWGSTISTAGTGIHDSFGVALTPAQRDDALVNLYDSTGNPLGLEDDNNFADVISINGAVGSVAQSTGALTYNSDVAGGTATTLGNLLDNIQLTLGLPEFDGTINNNRSVSINPAVGGDTRVPPGAIIVRGQAQTAFALSNLSVNASNADNDSNLATRFVANMSMTEVQKARDTATHATSITVYDGAGEAHIVTTTFTHSGVPGEWLWEATTNGDEKVLGGNSGRINFAADGSVASFTFNDGTTDFRFDPRNGAESMSIKLDVGGPGTITGITQFRSTTTTAAREQDGYPMGKLSEISIDEFGEVSGLFSNGVQKSLAKIYVAEFNNPAGLLKRGDSMLSPSNNSGEAVVTSPGEGASSRIKPGALEMSNVDLATEFTNLITTQRGYQASARVITSSDQMLQELVSLVR